jgi:hypothetical protein
MSVSDTSTPAFGPWSTCFNGLHPCHTYSTRFRDLQLPDIEEPSDTSQVEAATN